MKKHDTDLSAILYGRIQPQARELEEAVIGACMIEKEGCAQALEILSPEDFYLDSHRLIFEAIKELFKKNNPVDILTVTQQLRLSGTLDQVGGAYAVSELTTRVGSAANIEYHCLIIRQKSKARAMIGLCSTTIKELYDDSLDSEKVIQHHSGNVLELETENYTTKEIDSTSRMTATMKVIQAAMNQQGLSGINTGISELNRLTGGWQQGNLVTLGGRPGMFKTGLAVHFAQSAEVPVAFFEMEMSDAEVGMRQIASRSGLKYSRMRNGHLSEADWKLVIQTSAEIEKLPVYVDTFSNLNLLRFQSKMKKLIQKHGVKMAIIDYLQLVEYDDEDDSFARSNENQQISRFTKGLKNFAKQYKIPIILLCQLNRKVEEQPANERKRPKLHHLRDSGAIEQNSDVVLFTYRPDYYYPGEKDQEGNTLDTFLELILAKHKQGAVGTINLYADIKTNYIIDWDFRDRNPFIENNEPLFDKRQPMTAHDNSTPF